MAAVEFDNLVRNILQEAAVVGNKHERAMIILQLLLEPFDRWNIEVVGRLV